MRKYIEGVVAEMDVSSLRETAKYLIVRDLNKLISSFHKLNLITSLHGENSDQADKYRAKVEMRRTELTLIGLWRPEYDLSYEKASRGQLHIPEAVNQIQTE